MNDPASHRGRSLRDLPLLDVEWYPLGLLLAWLAWMGTVIDIPFGAFVRSLVIAITAGIVLCLALRAVLGDRHLAGLAGTAVVALLMAGQDARIALAAIAAFSLLVVAGIATARARRAGTMVKASALPSLSRFGRYATVVLMLIIAIDAFQVPAASAQPAPAWPAAGAPDARPDIYLLLLDGHPRFDVAEGVLGLADDPLRDALDEAGFVVAPQSRSNYPQTGLTLSSMLDGRHLDEIAAFGIAGDHGVSTDTMVRRALQDTAVLPFLDGLGYETVSIASGYGAIDPGPVDRVVDTGQLTEWELGLIRRSVFRPIIAAVGRAALAGQLRDRVEQTLASFVDSIAGSDDAPRFVLGHVPAPHGPMVYFGDGTASVEDIDKVLLDRPEDWPVEEFLAAYREHLVTVDGLAAQAVAEATARMVRPSIFLVLSDHGFRRNGPIGSALREPGGLDIAEQHRNLFAWRSDRPLGFGDRPTLVNVFPILASEVFGTRIACQESRFFFVAPEMGIREVADPDDGSIGPGTPADEPACARMAPGGA